MDTYKILRQSRQDSMQAIEELKRELEKNRKIMPKLMKMQKNVDKMETGKLL